MAMSTAGRVGLSAALKKAWNEVPEVIVSIVGVAGGLAASAYVIQRENERGVNGHKYKFEYTVKRRSDVADPTHPSYN